MTRLAAVGVLLLAVPAAARAGPGPRRYVALGDSYSAGNGLLPYDAGGEICRRSPLAYPRLHAAAHGLEVTHAACSRAGIDDIAAVQLDALGEGVGLVTITAGGNDVGFARVLAACVAVPRCQDVGRTLDPAARTMQRRLERLLRTIRGRTRPGARIAVLAYPLIAPASPHAGCSGLSPGELRWLRARESVINTAVHVAAARARVTFVDASGAFTGHELCTPHPWVNGLVDVPSASFHPTRRGQAALAEALSVRL